MKCPHCGSSSSLVRNHEGFLVCASCGTVIEGSNIVVDAYYNMRKSKCGFLHPLSWSQPLLRKRARSVEEMIAEAWSGFVALVERRAPFAKQHLEEFKMWLYAEGTKVLLRKALRAQQRGYPYSAKIWLEAQLKQEGSQMLYNLFIAWLHAKKGYSIYFLWKKARAVSSPEGIYTWLRVL